MTGGFTWRAVNLTAASAFVAAALVAPPGQPLDVVVVDDSQFPRVVLDVMVPAQSAAADVTTAMVSVDGVPVESLSGIDPATTAVAVVVDDRPEVDAASVGNAQGAALELAVNAPEGMQLAVYTPSGLQSALTADRNAAIARISGITAGAPDVVPIEEAITEAAEELGDSPLPDRHLLVSLGAPVTLDASQQADLTAALDRADARLHLLTPGAAPELASVAVASGGLAPATTELLAAADRVLAAIRDRYRAVTTVSGPGSHEVALQVDGTRYTAPVNMAAPPPPPPPTSPPPTAAPTAASAAPTTASAPPATSSASASTSGTPTSTARGRHRLRRPPLRRRRPTRSPRMAGAWGSSP